jgi:density-regulated protein
MAAADFETEVQLPTVDPIIVEYDPITGIAPLLPITPRNPSPLSPINHLPAHLSPNPSSFLSTHTGVPSEFNEFLPKDSDEYRKWKAGGSLEGAVEGLSLADSGGGTSSSATDAASKDKEKSSSKKKKKPSKSIILERNTRNKKKCITTINGLELFGVKLSEAAKLFGKKFASGASVVKTPEGKEEIDVQGDHLDAAVELILKQYKEVEKKYVYYVDNKKKIKYFDSDDDE